MDTPELDDAINVLKILKSRGNGELTERGERRLLEYETIKKQLALFSVSKCDHWTCEKCGKVANEEVTFEETHDGCGGHCC